MNEIPLRPEDWGPTMWMSLHSVAARCNTVGMKKAFPAFLNKLITEIPCEVCRVHARQYLDETPVTYNERDDSYGDISVLLWTWRFHNAVNQRLGKKIFSKHDLVSKYLPELTRGVCPQCSLPREEIKPTLRSGGVIKMAEYFPNFPRGFAKTKR